MVAASRGLWLWALTFTVFAAWITWSSFANASVNLPLHHWAYGTIERLVALGIIDRAMVISKPYSRKEAARYVAWALERITSDKIQLDGLEVLAEPLLRRLTQEFQRELADLGAIAKDSSLSHTAIRYGGRLQAEVDSFQIGQGTVRFRENRGGEYYADGTQAQTDIRGWVELTDALAITAQPKFISNRDALGLENSHNVYFRELNAKFTAFNIAVEIGRGSLWWGPGYHGSLLLTDHAFPLDMVKVGSDEPFRLPWILRHIGEWKVNTFLAQLERDRAFPRANLFGLRISYLPAGWLELGFTRLTQFGGRGSGQSFPQPILDAYLREPNQGGNQQVDEQVMLDFRAKIPSVRYLIPFPAGFQIYGELAGEDRWAWVGSRIRLTPRGPGYLVGVYIPQVFSEDSFDLRVEWADTLVASIERQTSNLWYRSMNYRGLPLGHHMGTDATDLFVRTTRYFTENLQLGVNFNFQMRGRLQPLHEKKHEAAVDLNWWLSNTIQFTVGYTFQNIEHPGQVVSVSPFGETFGQGVSNNHFLWTSAVVEF
jgi:hypothetical protein